MLVERYEAEHFPMPGSDRRDPLSIAERNAA